MRAYNWLSILLILSASCGKPLPSFENVDLAEWKSDKNGCLNKRSTMREAIELQKKKLLALNENQIIKLLGKPDQNELYKRNQKFYHYFLTPAPECSLDSTKASIFTIRFNAMGLAKEIYIE